MVLCGTHFRVTGISPQSYLSSRKSYRFILDRNDTLMEALRRLALKGTEWAQAQVDTIRLKLFKIGAIVKISVRRILLQFSSTYPWKDIFAQAFHALRG